MPTPPGPVIVTRRCSARCSSRVASSSTRPTSRDSAVGTEILAASGDGRGCRGRTAEACVLGEDEALRFVQLRPRVNAELLVQRSPDAVVDGERLGLPASGVQAPHQQRRSVLVQRPGGRQRVERFDRGLDVARTQQGLGTVEAGRFAKLVEAIRLVDGERPEADVHERRAAPSGQRSIERRERGRPGAVANLPPGRRVLRLEPGGIDLRRRGRQPIAAADRLDHAAVIAQAAADP